MSTVLFVLAVAAVIALTGAIIAAAPYLAILIVIVAVAYLWNDDPSEPVDK